jgi:hypothetical protein
MTTHLESSYMQSSTPATLTATWLPRFEYDMETQTNLKRYLEVKAERKQKLKDEGIRLNENSAEMEEYRTKEERQAAKLIETTMRHLPMLELLSLYSRLGLQLVEDALGKAKVEGLNLQDRG